MWMGSARCSTVSAKTKAMLVGWNHRRAGVGDAAIGRNQNTIFALVLFALDTICNWDAICKREEQEY